MRGGSRYLVTHARAFSTRPSTNPVGAACTARPAVRVCLGRLAEQLGHGVQVGVPPATAGHAQLRRVLGASTQGAQLECHCHASEQGTHG